MTQPTPPDQPISRLSTFRSFATDWKREVREHAETVNEGLSRPGALTDGHVARIKSDCDERVGDLDMFEGQAARWSALPDLSESRRSGVKELTDDLAEIRRLNDQIRDTAALLERATLEQQMSVPDVEWGIAAVLGEQLPPRF
ncbi:hypothetical protein ACFC07_21760 [Streptomyces sp. NPDC056099]|uniref:hypothetical protein n=1 Tax=unclassified Streptomyces TaxID=2593676 RepID=UPI0035E0F1DB